MDCKKQQRVKRVKSTNWQWESCHLQDIFPFTNCLWLLNDHLGINTFTVLKKWQTKKFTKLRYTVNIAYEWKGQGRGGIEGWDSRLSVHSNLVGIFHSRFAQLTFCSFRKKQDALEKKGMKTRLTTTIFLWKRKRCFSQITINLITSCPRRKIHRRLQTDESSLGQADLVLLEEAGARPWIKMVQMFSYR